MTDKFYNENYVHDMELWFKEQLVRIKDCQDAIDTSNKIIDLNNKQIILKKELYNGAINDFNSWAIINGYTPLDKLY